MLPEHPDSNWIRSFLEEHLAQWPTVSPDRVVGSLRRLNLTETDWIADRLASGHFEVRQATEALETPARLPAVGAYVCGSALATGTGIAFVGLGCADFTELIAHEGTHFHDEIFEFATKIRISTRATELHAFSVMYKARARSKQRAALRLRDSSQASEARQWSRAIVDGGYFAASSTTSMHDRAQLFVEGFGRSAAFSGSRPLERAAARAMLDGCERLERDSGDLR